jgi:hypothetical protein
LPSQVINVLFAVWNRSDQKLFHLAVTGRSPYFICDFTQLEPVADYVIAVIYEQYPHLRGHLEAGGIPRLSKLHQKLAALTPLQKAIVKFDLAIPSVLLDAGAGECWYYRETETGLVWTCSEGLAIASLQMFLPR